MFFSATRASGSGEATFTASPFLPEYHDTRFARALIWTIGLALVGFLAWSANTPVYEMVSGEGMIRPEGLSQRIEHLEGGIVSRVAVAEGDVVAAGDTLLVLDDAGLRSDRRTLSVQVSRLEQDIARYDALRDIDLLKTRERDMDDLTGTLDPALFEELAFRAAQIDVIRRERSVAEARIATLQTRSDALRREIEILVARQGRYRELEMGFAFTRRDVEELDREILTLRANFETLAGERDVAEAEIARARSREAEVVGAYRFEAARKRAEAYEALTAARETIRQIDDRLSRSVLRAPVAGIVNALNVQGPGEIAGAGEILAEIVPLDGKAFAEIEIPAERIGGVRVGDAASLKVLTYDFTQYGDIDATVERISPSSFEIEGQQQVFRTKLSFDLDGFFAQDRRGSDTFLPITPGMTVVASIKSEQRTILSYLLKPLRVISDRGFTER